MTTGTVSGSGSGAGQPVNVQAPHIDMPVPVATVGEDGVVTYEFVSAEPGSKEAQGVGKPAVKLAPGKVITASMLSDFAEKLKQQGVNLSGVSDVVLVALLAAARAESEQEKTARTSMADDKRQAFLSAQNSAKFKAEAADKMMTGAGITLGLGMGFSAGGLICTFGSMGQAGKSMKVGLGTVTGSYTPVGAASPSTAPGVPAPPGGAPSSAMPPPPPAALPAPPAVGTAAVSPVPGSIGGPAPAPASAPAVAAPSPAGGGAPPGGGGGGAGGRGAPSHNAGEVAKTLRDKMAGLKDQEGHEAEALKARAELMDQEVLVPGRPDLKASLGSIEAKKAEIKWMQGPDGQQAGIQPGDVDKAKNDLIAMQSAFDKDETVKRLYGEFAYRRGAIDAFGSQLGQIAQSINGFGQTIHAASNAFTQASSSLTDVEATYADVDYRMKDGLATTEEGSGRSMHQAVESTMQVLQTYLNETVETVRAVAQNTGR